MAPGCGHWLCGQSTQPSNDCEMALRAAVPKPLSDHLTTGLATTGKHCCGVPGKRACPGSGVKRRPRASKDKTMTTSNKSRRARKAKKTKVTPQAPSGSRRPSGKPGAPASRPAPADSVPVSHSDIVPAKGQITSAAPRATKLGSLISLLQSGNGATIEAMCQATGWQAHSVRGALAGTLKRKGLIVVSSKADDGPRLYRLGGRA